MVRRYAVAAIVLVCGLACGGTPVPSPAPTPPAEVPAVAPAEPAGAAEPRALLEQKEAGCGFTYFGPDGKIWFAEEVGGGYVMANLGAEDAMMEPLPEEGKTGKAGVEWSVYKKDAATVRIGRKADKAKIKVKAGEGEWDVEATAKTNTCQ